MHALSILTALREEIRHAEDDTTRAWERYWHNLSEATLRQAIASARHTATLHRHLAERLEQAVKT